MNCFLSFCCLRFSDSKKVLSSDIKLDTGGNRIEKIGNVSSHNFGLIPGLPVTKYLLHRELENISRCGEE